jgi:hypothetical protein
MPPRTHWSALLSRPIPLNDGRLIRTLADARALKLRSRRDRLRQMLNEAAESGAALDIDRVTGQLEGELFVRCLL